MRTTKIAFATVGLGTALLCSAAYAQDYQYQGRASGMQAQQAEQGQQQTARTRERMGASASRGNTAAAETSTASSQTAQMGEASTEAPKYKTGRSVNDNGSVSVQAQNDQGAQQLNNPGDRSGGSIGGGYYNSAARGGGYYDNAAGWGAGRTSEAMDSRDIATCQMRFRSFDPATGTFLGFDGIRHPCP